MTKPTIITPAGGARVVSGESDILLLGQPPEVLKALMLNDVSSFNALILTDIREKGGSLTNNLEFPLYYFLFFLNGYAENRKLTLVGEEENLSQAIRLLRFTLTGPTSAELDLWGTEAELKKEWLEVADALAIKNGDGTVVEVEDFFDIRPFEDGVVQLAELSIKHAGLDQYEISNTTGSVSVDLSQDVDLREPYEVVKDNVPGGRIKFGLEVLGGASGFTPNEPCVGMALCYNGDYILIDAMPFLDQHLMARGISKNQISTVFLTHLHDDHCAMFPLMLMPYVVEVITTREIFNMAMEKLSCGLGWSVDTIKQHFKLYEVKPGETVNYYGLLIEPHVTVHSIPTIGATFSTVDRGNALDICIVGDNHNMKAINELNAQGVVRDQTAESIKRLYTQRFSILVVDGGEGAIHGDPEDAIQSESDRVVYVHTDELDNKFNTNFSLAVSGKRYTIVDGDPGLYSSQIGDYLSEWLEQPVSSRWLRSLLGEAEIRRYNKDDVIMVQDSATRDCVYMLITGYCEVVQHDGEQLNSVAHLQAGDLIGEMSAITGKGTRNASVVSRTPTTVCVFSEQTFNAFVTSQNLTEQLIKRWELRPMILGLPCFTDLTTAVVLKVSVIADRLSLKEGEELKVDDQGWCLMTSGCVQTGSGSKTKHNPSELTEFGWLPFIGDYQENITAVEDSEFIRIDREQFEVLLLKVPQLNYYLRKYRVNQSSGPAEWQIGMVEPR